MKLRRSAALTISLLSTACFNAVSLPGAGDTEEAETSGSASTTGAPTVGMSNTSSSPSTSGDPTDVGPGETGESGESTGTGETWTTGGTWGTDASSGTASADTEPPTVVVTDPADGAMSVVPQPVTITFSEPMETSTVEAAFPTADNFAWSDADDEVQFDLPFPFSGEVALFNLVVPASVRDVAGNEMGEDFVANLGLAAYETATLEYDAGLTGNASQGGSSVGSWFYAGDTTSDTIRFGGVSFPLFGLPDYDATHSLHSATFSTQVIDAAGDPEQAALGGWTVDHAEFASRTAIADPELLDAGFATLFEDGVGPGDIVDVDVTEQLEVVWADPAATHLQLRVHPVLVAAGGASDVVYLRRGADENPGIVHESVTNPDEANRARVTVRYFPDE